MQSVKRAHRRRCVDEKLQTLGKKFLALASFYSDVTCGFTKGLISFEDYCRWKEYVSDRCCDLYAELGRLIRERAWDKKRDWGQ